MGAMLGPVATQCLERAASMVQKNDQEEMSRIPLKQRTIDVLTMLADAQLKECVAKRS